jgi:TLC domain
MSQLVDVVGAYWRYTTRMISNETPIQSAFESVPNLARDSLIWSIVFTALMLATPFFFKTYWKDWYKGLDRRKKVELPPYAVSMIHHFTMVPLAWQCIYQDAMLVDYSNGTVDYVSFIALTVPICIGFIVSDTICFAAGQALAGVPEYMIHHVLTIWMVLSLMAAPGQLHRFFPHILICDTTNIFFNTAWLLRLGGYKASALTSICEKLFALSFLLVRCINVCLVMAVIFLSPYSHPMGLARYTLPPIMLLQWFWMSKIAATVLGLKKRKLAEQKHAVSTKKGK